MQRKENYGLRWHTVNVWIRIFVSYERKDFGNSAQVGNKNIVLAVALMCSCKDRDESETTARFWAEELCVSVHPLRLIVKKKNQKEKDVVFEKLGNVHGWSLCGRLLSCCSHLQEQSGREILVWQFLMKLLIAVNMALIIVKHPQTPLHANHHFLLGLSIVCTCSFYRNLIISLHCIRCMHKN